MNTPRFAALWRASGKPVLAGLLVVSLLLSILASASPCLHRWLHSDHQAPTHYCLVTVLEHGQTETVSTWVDILQDINSLAHTAALIESFFISHDLALHPERGPPVLS